MISEVLSSPWPTSRVSPCSLTGYTPSIYLSSHKPLFAGRTVPFLVRPCWSASLRWSRISRRDSCSMSVRPTESCCLESLQSFSVNMVSCGTFYVMSFNLFQFSLRHFIIHVLTWDPIIPKIGCTRWTSTDFERIAWRHLSYSSPFFTSDCPRWTSTGYEWRARRHPLHH